MKYFPINQVCLARSVDWQRSRRDSLWSAQKNMKGKREKKHLVNIGATATMTTDETSTFSRRSPAREKPTSPKAKRFFLLPSLFSFVCAVHVMCRDQTRT
jgi:hypothetical protein